MTDLRKLLIEARAWIVANEKHESVCPTRVMGTWGRCRCGFVSIIGRIDGALAEKVGPVACKHEPYQGFCAHCNAPYVNGRAVVDAAPADQWRRVDDWLEITGQAAPEGVRWVNKTDTHLGFIKHGADITKTRIYIHPLPALPEGE